MTKFNPEGKDMLTYRESLEPAMKITEQEDADQYFEKYVAFIQKFLNEEPRKDSMTAEKIAKINLGYYAGYYDHEIRLRVEKLFKCSHPIFGNASNGEPTSEEAFNAGKKFASK